MITQERLKQLLKYSPDTGLFYWRVDRGGKRAGAIAGVVRPSGYVAIGIDDKLWRAHQLVWLYMTGEWPPSFIDHRDLDRANNRWSNLRLATKSQNMANMGTPKHNSSGFKGVSRYRAGESYGKPWQASIRKDNRSYALGQFATKEEAHAAYVAAAERLFGEFARAA